MPVEQEALSPGDEVALGPYRLKFVWDGAGTEARKPKTAIRAGDLPTRIVVLGTGIPRELQEIARKDKNVVVETISSQDPTGRILGCTPHIQAVKRFIRRAALSDAPVLIRGESGTGKELVAQAIATLNPRRRPIAVVIDAASLDSALSSAELFGHEKGVFTGADRARKGQIELADGATLFLDEIGRASADIQNKLLRVLETGEFQPLGSRHTRKVDVRLVAATDKNLEFMIQQGQFSEALYYRLKGLELRLLPLRQRREDIPLLARHFLAQSAQSVGAPSLSFSSDALAVLCAYAWPGNVRQLKRCMESAVTLREAETITRECLPLDIRDSAPDSPTVALSNVFEAEKRAVLVRTLRQTGGNQNQAARILGVSRQAVNQMIQRYQICEPEWRSL
jgi:DNA-binding NtrC family response regulator